MDTESKKLYYREKSRKYYNDHYKDKKSVCDICGKENGMASYKVHIALMHPEQRIKDKEEAKTRIIIRKERIITPEQIQRRKELRILSNKIYYEKRKLKKQKEITDNFEKGMKEMDEEFKIGFDSVKKDAGGEIIF